MRRSTRTICWMPGIRIIRPGPLTLPEAAELEHHAALVFAQDAQRADERAGRAGSTIAAQADRDCDHRDDSFEVACFCGRTHLEREAVDAGRRARADLRAAAGGRARASARRRPRAQPSRPANSIISPTVPISACVPLTHRPPPRLRRHAGDAEHEEPRRRASRRRSATTECRSPAHRCRSASAQPNANAATPPMPSAPKLGTNASATKKAMPSRISASPA